MARSTFETVWRVARIGGLTFGHAALVGATVNTSWAGRAGAVAGAVALSEAVYRKAFPQGSRRVSGWVARALVIAQRIAADAPIVEAAVPVVAPEAKAAVALVDDLSLHPVVATVEPPAA